MLNFENLNSQIIEKYKQIIEISTKKDSVYELTYYKEIDSTLKSKLDSFMIFFEKDTIFEKINSYFYVARFTPISKTIQIFLSQKGLQNDYDMLTSGNVYTYRQSAFAYSFYKNRLIIFTTKSRSIHISDCGISTLKNLIFQHLDLTEQKNITNKKTFWVVKSQPSNTYYIH
jgi:hypothetical protein